MHADRVVRHRKVLSRGQVRLLELLSKYRFGSIELLLIDLGLKTEPGLRRKLAILVDKGYVGRHYESSYKIKGTPAAYYLTPKGLKVLQGLSKHPEITDKLIKSSYNDKTAAEPFINHNLRIYVAAHQLQQLYPDLKFFTKRDLVPFTHFPDKLPDSFLALKPADQEITYRFFLDIIPDSPYHHLIDDKITRYTQYFEEGGWEVTSSPLPSMLLLCESGATEKRTLRYVAKKLASLNSDEPMYYTSTANALKNATKAEQNIWTSVEDTDDILDLAAIGVNQ